jgi:hypothetical protein
MLVKVKLTTNSPKIIQRWRRTCGDRGSSSYKALARFLTEFRARTSRWRARSLLPTEEFVFDQNPRTFELGRQGGNNFGAPAVASIVGLEGFGSTIHDANAPSAHNGEPIPKIVLISEQDIDLPTTGLTGSRIPYPTISNATSELPPVGK